MSFSIGSFLDSVTMYRLVLYYLISLVAAALFLSIVGVVPYGPFAIISTVLVLLVVCIASNALFAKAVRAPTNIESASITALILALIVGPFSFPANLFFLIFVGIFAMASKYLVVLGKIHIFNPAAFSIVAAAVLFGLNSSWWVGDPVMLPFVLVGGFFVLKKVKGFQLAASFLFAYLFFTILATLLKGETLYTFAEKTQFVLFNSGILFFAFIMLVEPVTTPTKKHLRLAYGVLVAFFYPPQLISFGVVILPAAALLLGNLFSYITSARTRLTVKLKYKEKVAQNTFQFAFERVESFTFTPGQFLEFTLPHANADSRGIRRYFSIASSPLEPMLLVAARFPHHSSSFKKNLLNMKEGNKIYAIGPAGDFVLPKNETIPLIFLAGGIGITPFRSMLEYLIAKKVLRNITLFYSNSTVDDIAFRNTLTQAAHVIGLKTIYTLTNIDNIPLDWKGSQGFIDEKMIAKEVLNYKKSLFYISGPVVMVKATQKVLSSLGVLRGNIKTDYFPGYGG